MFTRVAAAALIGAACAGAAAAQTSNPSKPSGTKGVMYDITIKADDTVYTGTMETSVQKGKVTGNLRLTVPTEITGKVAGTAKGGVLALDFPYHMVERQCDGNVKMTIKLPAKPGPANGTMEATGCGRDPAQPLPGTVELVPATAKK